MSLDGLSGLVNRIIAWADRLQREHGVLGFRYAVVKKYGDDEGGRQAASPRPPPRCAQVTACSSSPPPPCGNRPNAGSR